VPLTCTYCMFFCCTAVVILVDASFISSFAWLAHVFVQGLHSLLLLAAEGVRVSPFYFSVVFFRLAHFQASLLHVIQLLSDVAVLPNITLSEPFLQL